MEVSTFLSLYPCLFSHLSQEFKNATSPVPIKVNPSKLNYSFLVLSSTPCCCMQAFWKAKNSPLCLGCLVPYYNTPSPILPILFTCTIIRHKSHSAQNAQMILMKLYSWLWKWFFAGMTFLCKTKIFDETLWIFKYSSGWISKSGIQINKERHRNK